MVALQDICDLWQWQPLLCGIPCIRTRRAGSLARCGPGFAFAIPGNPARPFCRRSKIALLLSQRSSGRGRRRCPWHNCDFVASANTEGENVSQGQSSRGAQENKKKSYAQLADAALLQNPLKPQQAQTLPMDHGRHCARLHLCAFPATLLLAAQVVESDPKLGMQTGPKKCRAHTHVCTHTQRASPCCHYGTEVIQRSHITDH